MDHESRQGDEKEVVDLGNCGEKTELDNTEEDVANLALKHEKKRERYQVNCYEKNEDITDEPEKENDFTYYVRPFIPFWSLQSLRFENVNAYDQIPAQRDKLYPRYVMEKLVRTWLRKDKQWFDRKEIFEISKSDIIDMLHSRYPTKNETPPKVCGIPEFPVHRTLILDCWSIYHHINFQDGSIDVGFDHFPLWGNSSEFQFNLYYEVKRVLSNGDQVKEMEGDKRLWMKESNMTYEIYKEFLRPTIFNTDIKILTTQHYVPKYLEKILSNKLGNEGIAYEYVQRDLIIIRSMNRPTKRKRITAVRNEATQRYRVSGENQLENTIEEHESDVQISNEKNDESDIMGEIETLKLKLSKAEVEMEVCKIEREKRTTEIEDLTEKNQELSRLLVENEEKLNTCTTENKKKTAEVQQLFEKIQKLEKSLEEEKLKNHNFTSPLSSQIIPRTEQKENLEKFVEYAYLVSAQPQSLQAKIKLIEKHAKVIQKYKKNTEKLEKIFLKKYEAAKTNHVKTQLKTELLLRTAHNQHQINSKKETIKVFLKQRFKDEFNELIEIIPKLFRFLIHCQQNLENNENLSCPDHIMKMDVTEKISKVYGTVDIRPMTILENFENRSLIDIDTEEISEEIDPDEIKKMDTEEIEKKFYRPFHDTDIS